jgi:hypothetical protein
LHFALGGDIMRPWKLSHYSPERDVYPVQDWYDDQIHEIKAAFDVGLGFFCANDDWTEAYELKALEGDYLGLHEIRVTTWSGDDQVEFGAIGAFRPDSCEFVLFLVCDRFNDGYPPCLDRALKYKQAWEQKDPKGGVYDYPIF